MKIIMFPLLLLGGLLVYGTLPDDNTGVLVKRGTTYGSSDELGFDVGSDRVHIHDLQATILHLLGIEHTRLTHRFQGRDYRLTDIHGNVVEAVLS